MCAAIPHLQHPQVNTNLYEGIILRAVYSVSQERKEGQHQENVRDQNEVEVGKKLTWASFATTRTYNGKHCVCDVGVRWCLPTLAESRIAEANVEETNVARGDQKDKEVNLPTVQFALSPDSQTPSRTFVQNRWSSTSLDSDEQIISAAHEALQIYGYVDVLVNNAANGVIGPVEELKLQDIRSQFQTNLFGVIAFTRPFVAHFRTRRTGHILNVSSIGSAVSPPGWAAYSGSKAALDSFTHALHQELKLFGVRVLCIMPGYFSTAFFADHRRDNSTEPAIDTSSRQSQIYTDPVTQGYDTINALPRGAAERGLIGDPEKFGQRIYEVVTETGMAEGLIAIA
ncbi:hypothetical protein EW026_g1628 [Hermanssonia centrifuga]|uniref:Uncharacterized protein n=1 Tax=Hermanssonia centrifuga TaxID=98765 RepID=A0A4S4KRD9_9APHY|nr:hypothetical protein EW026_g1628 [Hermanssonia centrifuga]